MKHITLFVCLLSFSGLAYGQQTIKLSQYLFNKYALNPATGGLYGCMEIGGGHREQWMGIDGAPQTSLLTIHREYGKDQNYKKGWHGLGIRISRDAIGPFSVIDISPSYAYHLNISKAYSLSFGLYVGIKQHTFSPGDISSPINNLSPLNTDPAFVTSNALIWPQFAPGIWLNSDKQWFAGLTMDQVWRSKMKGIGVNARLRPHLNLIAGRKIAKKGQRNMFEPSMMVQYTYLWPPSVDVSMKYYVGEKAALGASYRLGEGFVAMGELQLTSRLRVGYSYDYTVSRMRYGNTNTHEIAFRYVVCVNNEIQPIYYCPAYK